MNKELYSPILFFVILVSTMCMPLVPNLNAVPKLVVPSLFAVLYLSFVVGDKPAIKVLDFVLIVTLLIGQALYFVFVSVGDSSTVLLGSAWFVVAILLLNLPKSNESVINKLLVIYMVVATIWALVGLYVWAGFNGERPLAWVWAGIAITHDPASRPTGPFANSNVWSILIVCMWLITTHFCLNKQRYRLPMAAASFASLVCVFVGMSRGAWLAWFVVFLVVLVPRIKRREWTSVILLMLSVVVAWVVADFTIQAMQEQLSLTQRDGFYLSSSEARLVLYPSVFEIWKSHWFSGVGFGNISSAYLTGQSHALSYLPQEMNGIGATESAHNHFLQMIAEAGLFGLIFWVYISVLLFKHVLQSWKDSSSVAWVLLHLALLLWIQGLTNVSMSEPIPFFLFFMFLGLGLALQQPNTQKVFCLNITFMVVMLSVFLTILIYQSTVIAKSWKIYGQMISTPLGKARGPLISKALEFENIYPRVMLSVVHDFSAKDPGDKVWIAIQPNLEKAIRLEEWPELYQGLFYSYVKEGEWDKACTVGRFNQSNKWAGDINSAAYEGACNGQMPLVFKFAWQ